MTAPTTSVQGLLDRARRFIDEEVIPREDLRRANDRTHNLALVQELREMAVSQGLTAPRGAVTDGGLGLSWVQCCAYLETAGRSFLGPGALQCAAPGQPDITTLEALATPTQRERYLRPLVQGTLRSCFAMSEPAPGVGSDPRMLSSRAERTTLGWRLNGHKWFATSASVADFAIVMARTEIGPSLFFRPFD